MWVAPNGAKTPVTNDPFLGAKWNDLARWFKCWKLKRGTLMTPYILLGRKKLPRETSPTTEQVYDDIWQIWIDKSSGVPVVCSLQAHGAPTQYGETTITETREGADRTEGALQGSEFGETIQTRTREGIDQTEGNSVHCSRVGETTLTKTREGADQSDATQELNAAYSHF